MWEEWLTSLLKESNKVRDATREEVSEWMVTVYWEMVGMHILRIVGARRGSTGSPVLSTKRMSSLTRPATTTILEMVTMAGTTATATLTMIRCLTVMRRGRRVMVAMRRRVTVAMIEFFYRLLI
jgi:hypothetical protein